ncbi:hypothetical protein ISN76_13240 [Dyella halodurans]|uniref:Uncharacterized protein n=1 Tax=Dyella halodurans TaxID=1920171 RepID=A0ABV9C001_9GAMM|nr:hypothetical protein [Dyella halodurans]
MAVLVGIYLVQSVSIEVQLDGGPAWIGAWSVSRSPSGNRDDWEVLTDATTSQSFASAECARHAGEEEGAALARLLQGDDCLEPLPWCMEPSWHAAQDVSPATVLSASRRCRTFEVTATTVRSRYLH